MSAFPTGSPGIRTERSVTFTRLLLAAASALYFPSAKLIDGSASRDTGNTGDLDVLRPGTVMGKITASGKYAPSFLGATGVLHDTSVVTTTLTLPAAVVTEITRRIGATGTLYITGPATAAGTVNQESKTFTVATATTVTLGSAFTNDYIAGSWISANDGTRVPLCLVGNEDGIKVTDEDAASVDVPFASMLIGGIIDSSSIPFWSTDTAMAAWLVAQLNAAGQFVFDHNF